MPRIGIDLGGTKIEGVLLSSDGQYLHRQRLATPSGDYAATLSAISELVARLENLAGERCRVGIATPGAPSRENGLMKNCNSTCLNGRPLYRDLSEALGRDIRLANDADCFALSEAVDGAAAGAESVFGVILGTGVGGGVVIGGRLLLGANAIAGEWGHNPMPGAAEGRSCYCGRRDCIETYLSGAGLLASYRRSGGRADSVEQLVAAAAAGEGLALRQLEIYAGQLAQALATVTNVLDPEVIVLGGGLSNIDSLYKAVPQLWGDYVFSDSVRTRLCRAEHGDSSGVRGAAWLWGWGA